MPIVSVIIPTYNRKEYVQQAIDSVLAQAYTDYEIIVVDDGSIDGTGEALAARYGDKIRYVWQENQGESAARNSGIRLAKGKYIALLDSDDLWYPRKLEMQLVRFENRESMGFVSCLGGVVDDEGSLLPDVKYGDKSLCRERTYEELYRDYMAGNTSCVLIKREVLSHIGGFDESIQYGEDEDLFLQIAAISGFDCVPEILVSMRVHEGGQWFFPKPDRTTKHLNDHLTVIQKGYDIWPDRPPYAEIVRDRRIGAQYARAAIEYFAYNEFGLGQGALSQAAKFDSETWMNMVSFKPIVFELAHRLEGNRLLPAGTGIPVVKRIAQQLSGADAIHIHDPAGAPAQILLELGYYFSAHGERARAFRYLGAAIRENPRYMADRGVQFELIKNSLGNSIAQRGRKAFRNFRGMTDPAV